MKQLFVLEFEICISKICIKILKIILKNIQFLYLISNTRSLVNNSNRNTKCLNEEEEWFYFSVIQKYFLLGHEIFTNIIVFYDYNYIFKTFRFILNDCLKYIPQIYILSKIITTQN